MAILFITCILIGGCSIALIVNPTYVHLDPQSGIIVVLLPVYQLLAIAFVGTIIKFVARNE